MAEQAPHHAQYPSHTDMKQGRDTEMIMEPYPQNSGVSLIKKEEDPANQLPNN
jgi:hypothetical protein